MTSCPASRAASTRATRSGVRSSSRVTARALARTSATAPLDMLAGRAQQRALEMVPDHRAAGVEQVVEELEQHPLGLLLAAAGGLDALADVLVEELDRPPGRALGGRRVLPAQLQQGTQWDAGRQQLHARRQRLQVSSRVADAVLASQRDQQPRLLSRLQQR